MMKKLKNLKDFGFNELYIGKIYSRWIYSIIHPFIQKSILEIGSGIGSFIENFSDDKPYIASDINKNYLKIIKQNNKNKKKLKIIFLNIEEIPKIEIKNLKRKNIDTIITINLLEHIKDDQRALNNIYKILTPSGKVIIFVPAHPMIYGSLDKAFGHYRRYTREEIINKLTKSHFKINLFKNFNFFGIFWWFFIGKILKKKNLPKYTGILLSFFVPILKRIESLINIPIGQSFIIVASK